MNETLNTIKNRYSVRGYKGEVPTKEEIDAVIKAGLMAPTGMNLQEIVFSVISGKDASIAELETEKCRMREIEVKELNSFYNAPVVIMLSAPEENRWSAVDAGIAIENMSLAAASLGLGSLIVGSVFDAMRGEKENYFKEKFGIAKENSFMIALALGYADAVKEPHTFEEAKQVVNLLG